MVSPPGGCSGCWQRGRGGQTGNTCLAVWPVGALQGPRWPPDPGQQREPSGCGRGSERGDSAPRPPGPGRRTHPQLPGEGRPHTRPAQTAPQAAFPTVRREHPEPASVRAACGLPADGDFPGRLSADGCELRLGPVTQVRGKWKTGDCCGVRRVRLSQTACGAPRLSPQNFLEMPTATMEAAGRTVLLLKRLD